MLSKLNFKAITAIATNKSSSGSLELFSKMAKKYSICVNNTVSLETNDINSNITKNIGALPVVVIATGDDNLDNILKVIASTEHVTILLVDNVDIISTITGQYPNVVAAGEKFSAMTIVSSSITNEHLDFEVNDDLTKKYFTGLNMCTYNDSSHRINCPSDALSKHFSIKLTGRNIISTLMSYLNIESIIGKRTVSNCMKFRSVYCLADLKFHSISINELGAGYPYQMFDITEDFFISEPVPTTIFYQDVNLTKVSA